VAVQALVWIPTHRYDRTYDYVPLRGYGKVDTRMDKFEVVDQAAKVRYVGSNLAAAYGIWQQLAVQHEASLMDEYGNVQTDMDCGGGNTMFWDDGIVDAVVLMDTACGREGSCWDCTDDKDYLAALAEDDAYEAESEARAGMVDIGGKWFSADDIGECCNVRAGLHDPDGHEFSGTMDYNFVS
jgi:hypothetical protein